MKMFNEDDVLDPEFRAKVITEIIEQENINRKKEFLKRWEIYKDLTVKWVIRKLLRLGLKEETVRLMENHAANISIARKVVNKLARTYSGGVLRSVEDDDSSTQQVSELTKLINFDQKQKKADRYLQLHRNGLLIALPERTSAAGEPDKYKIKLQALSPWQYDVVQDGNDHEKMGALILSNFVERTVVNSDINTSHEAGIHKNSGVSFTSGDSKDNTIADSGDDTGMGDEKEYVWWTNKYHFTTDSKGEIIPSKSPEDLENPIEMNPATIVADDQDGEFWARGGDDLTDGSILINTMITDMFSIAYKQGWGQWIFTGKNLPSTLEMGTHSAILLDWDKDEDPEPKGTIVSANPPLDQWMSMIEQYTAMLLSTNNLSTSAVTSKLGQNASFPSGIALMIEQSQATDNIEDKQEKFKNIERREWEVIKRWHNFYHKRNELIKPFQDVGLIREDLDISIQFVKPKPVISEKENLENIEKRKNLGVSTMVELLRMDNPDLDDEAAEAKLKRILEEKKSRLEDALKSSIDYKNNPDQGEDEKEDLDNG